MGNSNIKKCGLISSMPSWNIDGDLFATFGNSSDSLQTLDMRHDLRHKSWPSQGETLGGDRGKTDRTIVFCCFPFVACERRCFHTENFRVGTYGSVSAKIIIRKARCDIPAAWATEMYMTTCLSRIQFQHESKVLHSSREVPGAHSASKWKNKCATSSDVSWRLLKNQLQHHVDTSEEGFMCEHGHAFSIRLLWYKSPYHSSSTDVVFGKRASREAQRGRPERRTCRACIFLISSSALPT